MKKRFGVVFRVSRAFLFALVSIFILMGPGFAGANEARLKEKTEQLFLNYKILEALYGDLREITGGYIYNSDEQLNYMQKMTLFVNEARMICYYQWQLLSVMDYIKPEAKNDYYTLRRKDLLKAKTDLAFVLSLLDLYRNYIVNKAALQPVDEAAVNIKANVYIFESLMELLDELSK
jgi:hypothetical protein